MKITIIRHSIRNRGGDRLVLEYLNYLIQKGHSITYWTNEVNTHFPINSNICIKKIPLPGVPGTILFMLLNKFHSDVLIVDLVVMAYFASFRNKNKILYLAQDYDVFYHRSSYLKNFTEFAYHQVLHRLTIATIAVSQGLTDQLKKYSPVNLTTIPNGINTEFFKRPTILGHLPPNKTKSIIYFARDDHRKGLDIAIESFKKLKALHKLNDWEIRVIGTARFEEEGLPIKKLGFLKTDAELREALNTADIYLVSSRSEGLSLLLLQALACGCAVVSTSASTILSHGVNGLVSPIEDSDALAENLNQVLYDTEMMLQLSQNGRLLSEQFSWEKSCSAFKQFIENNVITIKSAE